MNKRETAIILFCLITASLILSACNLPTEKSLTTEQKAATIVAQTLTAAGPSNTSPLPISQTTPHPQELNTPTKDVGGDPMLEVSEATNCRTGPDVGYEKLFTLQPGTRVRIEGSMLPGYWLIENGDGTCWLYAEFATPVGSYQSVPTVTAPPTPTGTAPGSVIMQKWDYFCANSQADISIVWSDVEGETGYRVYRNGEMVAELLPNTTSYSETINLLSGQSVGYNVEAFNFSGSGSSKVITMTCP